jgi:hypothetical protein
VLQFVTTAAESLNHIRTEERGSDRVVCKSRNLGGFVDFRFLIIARIDPVATALLGSDVVWKSNSVPLIQETASAPDMAPLLTRKS